MVNNPIPQSLEKECSKVAKILNAFIDPRTAEGPDKIIPSTILERCKGIAVLTVIKGGFIWSGRAGSGLVIARLPDGSWSAPSAIGTAGVGFGGQIGAELTDFVMILNTSSAVRAFSHGGNVTLGGNIGIAAGPIGRSAEVSGALLNVAPVFSYSKTKGLFAGISLEGSAILERKDANEKFYGRRVSARALLAGEIPAPPAASMIYRALELKSGISTSGRSSIRSGSYRSSEPVEDIKETGSTYNRSDSRYHLSGSQSRYGSRGTDSGIGEYAGRSALNRSILDSPEKSFSAPLPKYENSTPGYGGYPREKASLTPGFPNPPSSTPFSTSSSQKRRPPPPPPPPAPAAPQPKDTEVRVLALYAFSGQTDGDLSFSKGDVITVVKKTDSQDDWWDGSLNGKVGQFPANYVKLL